MQTAHFCKTLFRHAAGVCSHHGIVMIIGYLRSLDCCCVCVREKGAFEKRTFDDLLLPDKLQCLRVFLQLVLSEIDAVFHTESPLDPMCAGGQGQRPPIRKMDVCCDVTRNRKFVSDRISLIPPAALDVSHRGIINCFGVP